MPGIQGANFSRLRLAVPTAGHPVSPRGVMQDKRKEASNLVELYGDNEPVREFYAGLVAHAERGIRLDVDIWDTGDDE